MFILKCSRDNSFCKIDESEVIFNKDSPPKEGETVKFLWYGNEEFGEVVMESDNIKKINQKFEQVKKDMKKRPRTPSTSPETTSESHISSKRSRKPNAKYNSNSFENLEFVKPPKEVQVSKLTRKDDNKNQSDKMTQLLIEKDIAKKKTDKSKSKKISPTKDELKQRLAELEGNMKKSAGSLYDEIAPTPHTVKPRKNNKSNNENNSATESDSDVDKSVNVSLIESEGSETEKSHTVNSEMSRVDDTDKENNPSVSKSFENLDSNNAGIEGIVDDYNDPDLYGKDWSGEKMYKLMDRIYCKEKEYKECSRQCTQASHFIRRLITGVLKPSGYVDATLTGQASRAHPQEEKLTPVRAFNTAAKNEIIGFAMALAKIKGWKGKKGIEQTEEELAAVMSQKIGELKRAHVANKKAKS
ncbi:hypothetical protein KQX54_012196 [Cotesia glomerata]|uniref:BEN domain-containing protein n=1 Tax=Cotesia glomerata TaxID=32391 RepID=A0AAV7HR30_COTGL|nr:hypothetical protein KQX54_012196 [Cotesia glomerata]